MPAIMQPAALRSIRKVVNDYQIYFYSRPLSILHVKAILIDQKNLILGSVNMNQRSFIHDTEFSILFNEATVIADFKRQIKADILPYMSPLTADQLPPKSVMELLVKPLMKIM